MTARVHVTWVTPCCPVPAANLGTAVMILPGVPVPGVTILVVMMWMGDFIPGLLVIPAEKRDRGTRTSNKTTNQED